MPKDMLGKEINKGDIIAYANIIGRSAMQCVYEVVDIVEVEQQSWGHTETVYKLKAKALKRSYHGNPKSTITLAMLERCIVLPKSYKDLVDE